MSILGMIVVGLVAGFIGSKLVGKSENSSTDVLLGTIGAIVAGFVLKADVLGITMTDTYTMVIALFGALALLFVYHNVLKH